MAPRGRVPGACSCNRGAWLRAAAEGAGPGAGTSLTLTRFLGKSSARKRRLGARKLALTAVRMRLGDAAEGTCVAGRERSGLRRTRSAQTPSTQRASESGYSVPYAFPCPVQGGSLD